MTSADAQVAQLGERIRKSGRSPTRSPGTVLATYVQSGRVRAARPAALQDRESRFGGRARLRHRAAARRGAARRSRRTSRSTLAADARQTLTGTVTWISSQAEFTPTPIQTRDERADLVYAVKIRVPNRDGALKIGMPVDVRVRRRIGRQ